MSVVIVAASCASGVALVLILVGVVGAVRCRRVRGGGRRRPTSGGASKRLPVDADGDVVGLAVPASPRLDLVDCSRCRQSKHRRGRVTMNGIKEPARSRRCSNESSVSTEIVPMRFFA